MARSTSNRYRSESQRRKTTNIHKQTHHNVKKPQEVSPNFTLLPISQVEPISIHVPPFNEQDNPSTPPSLPHPEDPDMRMSNALIRLKKCLQSHGLVKRCVVANWIERQGIPLYRTRKKSIRNNRNLNGKFGFSMYFIQDFSIKIICLWLMAYSHSCLKYLLRL